MRRRDEWRPGSKFEADIGGQDRGRGRRSCRLGLRRVGSVSDVRAARHCTATPAGAAPLRIMASICVPVAASLEEKWSVQLALQQWSITVQRGE